jgi:ABC-type uncharacterized transport system involved in gliding motility auxiliary subunit
MSNAVRPERNSEIQGKQIVPTSVRMTQWTFAGIRLVLLLGSLFFISWIVNDNPVAWDLTETGMYSLSEQSIAVVESLDRPVSLIAFVRGADDAHVSRALETYAESSGLISFRLVDPLVEPALATEYQVRDYGALVVSSGERVVQVGEIKEPAITNAILAVTRGEPDPVCLTFGHGERDPAERGREGLSAASTALSQTHYEVRTVNLLARGDVPGDCRVLTIAGPGSDFQSEEVEAVQRYLETGGRVLVMLESGVDTPELDHLLARWGVRPNPDFIIDTGRNGQALGLGVQVPMVDAYQEHPITDGFRLMTMYDMPRSIGVAGTMPDGLMATVIAASTRSSWGETSFRPGSGATWTEEEDLAGPLPIVVAVADAVEESGGAYRARVRSGEPAPVGEPHLVVIGDSDFVSNAFFGWQGNGDLMVNSINWLAGQEELIAILPKEVANKRVLLTDSRRGLAFALLVLLLPMIPAATGVVIMARKLT